MCPYHFDMRSTYIVQFLLLTALLILIRTPSARCQQQGDQATQADKQAPADQSSSEENQAKALAKAVQNPVASLISVPLQNNTNFDIGPNNRDQNILNVEPVIPVRVSTNWNLVMRIITPIIYQPSIASLLTPANTPLNHLGTLGLGDMNPTFFLSPAKAKKLIWGIGPSFLLPTATDDVLGQKKMGHWAIAGPADPAGTLDHRRLGQQHLVICRQRQLAIFPFSIVAMRGMYLAHWNEYAQGRESNAAAVLHQLQPEKAFLHHVATDHHCQLGSDEWKRVDCAFRWRDRKNHEIGEPTGEPAGTVLWERKISPFRRAVEYASAALLPVSQVNEG